jgi:hypothetical protein
MNHQDRERIPEDLAQIAAALREHRPKADGLELDRIKLRVRGSQRGRILVSGKGYGLMRARLIGLLLAVGLLGGGTAALAAVGGGPFSGGSKSRASANSQYCPPNSQQPGKPKKPGPANCGNPKTKKCVNSKSKTGRSVAGATTSKKRCVTAKGKKNKKGHKHGKKHKKHKHKKHKKHGNK